ncbi:MAG: tetratricopeptide repeat protein [Candidatus Cloacimonetes bacterium]|nr:tetratricopeptide repeat protein [Candidatus Cloacimonadota bacterium]
MKSIIIILFFLLSTAYLFAQLEITPAVTKEGQDNDSLVVFFTGKLDFENKLYDTAIKKFKEYALDNPDGLFSAEAIYMAGKSYVALDSINTAIQVLEKNYNDYPLDEYGILSLREIGDIYFSQQDYEKAKLYYTQFIYFNSPLTDKDHAFLQIEKCNFYLGIYKNPTEIYTQFIKKFPLSSKVPKLQFELANYYVTVSNFEEAIKEYTSLIDTYPHCTWLDSVYYNLSIVYKSQNNWEKTVETTIALLNRFPQSDLKSDSYELFIDGMIANHQFLQAIDTLNSIIETAPQDEKNEYYQLLAKIYEELGLNQELVYIYQIMIENETDVETAALLRLKLELIKVKTGTDEDTLKPIDNELD